MYIYIYICPCVCIVLNLCIYFIHLHMFNDISEGIVQLLHSSNSQTVCNSSCRRPGSTQPQGGSPHTRRNQNGLEHLPRDATRWACCASSGRTPRCENKKGPKGTKQALKSPGFCIQTTELSTIIQTWLIPGLIIFILPKVPSFKTLNIFKSSPAIAAPRHVEASLRPLSEVQRLHGLPFQGTQHRQVPNPSRESLLLLHGAWDPWV